MDLSGLSITELKQMLARVNHDLKLNKPTMSRKAKAAAKPSAAISELAECNAIAARFTGKQYAKPVQNARLLADIAIQHDILDYVKSGGHIITRKTRKNIKPLSVASLSLYKKIAL